MDKKSARLRRARKSRSKMREINALRLSVHRTPQHIYAQIIEPTGNTIASASSIDKALKADLKTGGNIDAATAVGKLIAERARDIGVESVAFDRSGFKYHGRVKALAEAAREAGLKF
ncbi:MAG TPA: 50S ribosomal protein L18 [Chromatiales bacterium]|nr:50S ribosomal protein L18 [Thiotrichales bacterium]HIP67897.1 50S ribosomal protein L18 [Chromatiales bacterium]